MAKAKKTATASEQEARIAAQKKRMVRFSTVAAKRVQKALLALDRLAQCANRRSYGYDQTQVDKINNALGGKVSEVMAKFTAKESAKAADSFTL